MLSLLTGSMGQVAPLDCQDLGVLILGDVALAPKDLAERHVVAAVRLEGDALVEIRRRAVLAVDRDFSEEKILIGSHVVPGL